MKKNNFIFTIFTVMTLCSCGSNPTSDPAKEEKFFEDYSVVVTQEEFLNKYQELIEGNPVLKPEITSLVSFETTYKFHQKYDVSTNGEVYENQVTSDVDCSVQYDSQNDIGHFYYKFNYSDLTHTNFTKSFDITAFTESDIYYEATQKHYSDYGTQTVTDTVLYVKDTIIFGSNIFDVNKATTYYVDENVLTAVKNAEESTFTLQYKITDTYCCFACKMSYYQQDGNGNSYTENQFKSTTNVKDVTLEKPTFDGLQRYVTIDPYSKMINFDPMFWEQNKSIKI